MILGKYFKSPDENKQYTIDYTDWLGAAETIVSVVYAVSPSSGSPVVVNLQTINVSGKGLAFYISGGTIGVTYRVDVEITTSLAQVKEDVVQFTVKAA